MGVNRSLCHNPELFISILYQNIIFSDSASYFLEMSMVIILVHVDTMTQLRMRVGCIIFPGMGHRRGQYAFLMSKSRMVDICLERADFLAFRLCCFTYAVLIFCVPFPYAVWGRKWNSIVSVPDHCLFIFFSTVNYCFRFSVSYFLEMIMPVR